MKEMKYVLPVILLFCKCTCFHIPSPLCKNRFGTQTPNSKTVFSTDSKQKPFGSYTKLYSEQDDSDNEIERLRVMASQLRAEASKLEAERAAELANAAQIAFQKFDTNQDGEISVEELKAGLEKVLKVELSSKRVEQLMEAFDDSGDGKLQLEEFVTIDKFRNKLEALVRDEKEAARAAQKKADEEAREAAFKEEALSLINDKPPTGRDKGLSVLPYLFPLLDGLQFGRFLLGGNEENPIVGAIAVIYALYRSIPFGGFIAFFALNILSGNLKFNKLIRYNLQQAIFLDIALFFPGLVIGILEVILKGVMKLEIPATFTEVSNDVIFFSLLASLAYCTVSSLLGITPNKIPLISKAVDDRVVTGDVVEEQILKMKEREDEEKKNKK